MEKVIDEFTCAAELRILIQGKLFVSNEAIYFYSSCNDKFLFFGKSTKVKIMLSDIRGIKVAKNIGIFDNSILIKLEHDYQLFLTSFISRDKCYFLIR